MKMKKLLNSLTRVASAAVLMVGLSLSSFAQTSGGFTYQAAIDPSYTTVTVEWTIGSQTGVETVDVINGIISTVIGNGVNFVELTDRTLDIRILDGTEVIATSSQEIQAVPYADVALNAANVYLNNDNELILNNDTVRRLNITSEGDGADFTTVNIDYTNDATGAGFTSILGGTAMAPASGDVPFTSADAAVLGYDKTFMTTGDGLGVLGAKVYNLNGAGDEVYAGFFVGDVLITAQNDDAETYKTLDVDYTNKITDNAFTAILGGTVSDGTNVAEAAVVGYDKAFTQDPTKGGLGVLGAKVNDEPYAGYFVGNVAVTAENDGEAAYKTLDVDYTTPNGAFTSILGGTVSYSGQTAEAAVVGYDKNFTQNPADGGLGVLGAKVDDEVYAGFFVGNVAITALNEDGTQYKALDVDYTTPNGAFTAILGGTVEAGSGISAEAAVVGYDKAFTQDPTQGGLGVLGAKITDGVNESVYAGFFVGDVLVDGTLEVANMEVAEISSAKATYTAVNDGSELTYKTVDVDYTTPNNAFTAILGGTVTDAGITAEAAVVGYDKAFTQDPTQGGLGVLGAKLNGVPYAGFFVGDVLVDGKLDVAEIEVADMNVETVEAVNMNVEAVEAAKAVFTAVNPGNPEYKTLDVDYTTPHGGFTAILGGTAPAPNPGYSFGHAEAAVVGYDKVFTQDPAQGGLGVLGAKLCDLTGEYYTLYGNEKVFAGFFVGDVLIEGNLAVRGNVVLNMIPGTYADAAALALVHVPCTAEHPEGSVVIAIVGGAPGLYYAYAGAWYAL